MRARLRAAVDVPVTVKCRIGVDAQDEDADPLHRPSARWRRRRSVVHARKAWLQGLSPKENREVPPLNYARVSPPEARVPQLTVVINGGITTVEAIGEHLQPASMA